VSGEGGLVIAEFRGSWRFLSNFWPCAVRYDGALYPSAEHAYQAAKTTDPDMRLYIAQCRTPGEAKRAGRDLPLRPGWDGPLRTKVMLMVVADKFLRNPELAGWLAATGGARLVEGNTWHDNFWGDCHCGKLSGCSLPGRNLLGLLLEGVRVGCSG
jgi:ribA/ribD-fused uncharacterized protein